MLYVSFVDKRKQEHIPATLFLIIINSPKTIDLSFLAMTKLIQIYNAFRYIFLS